MNSVFKIHTVIVFSALSFSGLYASITETCGDGVCVSPEYAQNCPMDCGERLSNPSILRNASGFAYSWDIRPEHAVTLYSFDGLRNITSMTRGVVLVQNGVPVLPSTTYDIRLNVSVPECIEFYIHTDMRILLVVSNFTSRSWTSPESISGKLSVTVRAACDTTLSSVSLLPVPSPSGFGLKYNDIVDSIIDQPFRVLSPDECRSRCLSHSRCCAWELCPGTDAEGCGGCYLLGRKPDDSSFVPRNGWFAATERSSPVSDSVDDCRKWLLSQSSHEKDFYDTASGKLQKYVGCANVIRDDRTVPIQIFVGGVHIPTILVANHRTPDPRYSVAGGIVPHFLILPFYDTNIGNTMKHTTAMNLVQSYEMQSILLSGEVFVDVGANLGSYTLGLAERLGPSGIVIAVEPFRWLFQLLNANIALNGFMNCYTYQIALGDVSGRQDLLQPNLRWFSSPGGVKVDSQPGDDDSDAESRKRMYDVEWGKESVDTWKLDDVVFGGQIFENRNRKPQVDLIKIDVEGMELNVVRGAVRVLKELKPIVWSENVDFFASNDTAFLDLMRDNDYSCWKSLHAGNDVICEPTDGSRTERLAKVAKAELEPVKSENATV